MPLHCWHSINIYFICEILPGILIRINKNKWWLAQTVNQVDLNSRSPNSVLFCDITPNGKYIASGTHDGSIFIWKLPEIVRDETVVALEQEKKKNLIQQITRYRNVRVIAMMDDSDLNEMSLSQLEACLEQCIKYHENFKTLENCNLLLQFYYFFI